MKWFIEDSKAFNLDKEFLERKIVKIKKKILDAYFIANEIEGEVILPLLNISFNKIKHVEIQALSNSVLIRLVRNLPATENEEVREIVYLGEIEIPGKIPHKHEHSKVKIEVKINWFQNVLKKLGVSEEEKEAYIKKVNESSERIFKALTHAGELEAQTVIIIDGEIEEHFKTLILKTVEIIAKSSETAYIYFTEEHIRTETILRHVFRMGKVNIDFP